jgi:hypothetical protein
VTIRGGEDEEDGVETENIPTTFPSSAVSEDEGSDYTQQHGMPSAGVLFDLPPKIPRVEFPERLLMALDRETPTTRQRPSTIRSTIPSSSNMVPPATQSPPRQKVLVLMDVFCDYHGLFLAAKARDVYGVVTIPVYSDYMRGYFLHLHPDDRPENIDEVLSMAMPSSLEEVQEWCSKLDNEFDGMLLGGAQSVNGKLYELVGVVCDSDSGLANAEQLADWLNVTTKNPGGVREERRNKYLMIESIRSAGIPTVQQKLCTTREEAVEFATALLGLDANSSGPLTGNNSSSSRSSNSFEESRNKVVIKPVRGCASDDVYLCHDVDSVISAFDRIYGSVIFGSPGRRHEAVLVQEFASGQEYAIDTVSKDGKMKIVAIWKYDKRPANGAPFVYYATRLFDDNDHTNTVDNEAISSVLYEYLNSCLDALSIKWGITHSEVIVTPSGGPRLVEVNCRQHNMDFLSLTMGGIGYNLYDVLLAAYFGGDGTPDGTTGSTTTHDGSSLRAETSGNYRDRLVWEDIPDIPTKRMGASMVHLVNSETGTLKRVNEKALYEMQAMESVIGMEVYRAFLEIGTRIYPTVDIKSDAGWIQLVHPDSDIFNSDYQRIIELMPTLFEVEEQEEVTGAPGSADG